MLNTNFQKFDGLLSAFAQSHPDIESLFDTFFFWLRMRTDIFHLRTETDNSKGFDEGEAEKLLLKVFRRHQKDYHKHILAETEKSIKNAAKQNSHNSQKSRSNDQTPSVKNQSDLKTKSTSSQDKSDLKQNSITSDNNLSNNETTSSVIWISSISKQFYKDESKIKETVNHMMNGKGKCIKIDWPDDPGDHSLSVEIDDFEAARSITIGIKEKKFANKFLWENYNNSDFDTEQGDIEAELITYTSNKPEHNDKNKEEIITELDDIDLKHFNTWNGAITKEYAWSQSIDEISLEFFKLNKPVIKSEIKIILGSQSLLLEHKGKVIKDARLYDIVNKNDLIWSIEDHSRILITLYKSHENWWPSVFIGDEEIDTSKIESVKQLSEYDDATQAQVHKMVHEQSLKIKQGKDKYKY